MARAATRHYRVAQKETDKAKFEEMEREIELEQEDKREKVIGVLLLVLLAVNAIMLGMRIREFFEKFE